jgi:hypothetical protein
VESRPGWRAREGEAEQRRGVEPVHGGPPVRPVPDVGEDAALAGAERLVERVRRVWGMPSGRYATPRVPDRSEVPPKWQLGLAVACVVVLSFLLVRGGPAAADEPMLSRLFRSGAPIGQLAVGAAVALAAARWIVVRRRGWSARRRATPPVYLLIPTTLAVLLAAGIDAVSVAPRRFSKASLLVLGGLCVAAIPIGVSQIERPRLGPYWPGGCPCSRAASHRS